MDRSLRMTLTALFAAAFVIGINHAVFAIVSAPTSGFAYDVYDIAVNKILKGPIGFVGGVGAIALGAIMAIRAQIMGAIPTVLGGAVLLKADAITESLGALI